MLNRGLMKPEEAKAFLINEVALSEQTPEKNRNAALTALPDRLPRTPTAI